MVVSGGSMYQTLVSKPTYIGSGYLKYNNNGYYCSNCYCQIMIMSFPTTTSPSANPSFSPTVLICPVGYYRNSTICIPINADCYSRFPGATSSCPFHCPEGSTSPPGSNSCNCQDKYLSYWKVDTCVPIESVSQDVINGFIGAGVAIIVILSLIYRTASEEEKKNFLKPLILAISAVLDFGSDILFIVQAQYQLQSPTNNQINKGIYFAAIIFVAFPAMLNIGLLIVRGEFCHRKRNVKTTSAVPPGSPTEHPSTSPSTDSNWDLFFKKLSGHRDSFHNFWGQWNGWYVPLMFACLTPLIVLHFAFAYLIAPTFYVIACLAFTMTWMAAAITCADITVHACGSANVDNSWILTGAILEDIPQLALQIAFAVVNSRSSYLQIVSLIFSGWHIAFIFISLTLVDQTNEPFKNSSPIDNIDTVLGVGLDMYSTLIAIIAVIFPFSGKITSVMGICVMGISTGYASTDHHDPAGTTTGQP